MMSAALDFLEEPVGRSADDDTGGLLFLFCHWFSSVVFRSAANIRRTPHQDNNKANVRRVGQRQ
jgi:hypothetical protein